MVQRYHLFGAMNKNRTRRRARTVYWWRALPTFGLFRKPLPESVARQLGSIRESSLREDVRDVSRNRSWTNHQRISDIEVSQSSG